MQMKFKTEGFAKPECVVFFVFYLEKFIAALLFIPTLYAVKAPPIEVSLFLNSTFQLWGLRQNGARPPIFHFSLAESIYQQCPDKNKICNLSPSRAKPPRWTGLPGG